VVVLISSISVLDGLSQRLSHIIGWLPLLMALLTVLVVVLRYGFGVGAIAAQESVIYLHGTLFMLGASCTLHMGGHVRVDVFYQRFTPRIKAWIDALGHVMFTLPLCALIGFTSQDYVIESWVARETSPEPGGIPAVFLLKTLLPIMAALLALQALSEIIKALKILVTEVAQND
jgi:TRAP-type mannitol/chloroaromatic compound transport system permease small subunit